jgi:hypothetical protein
MIGFSLEYNKKQDLEKKIKLEENASFHDYIQDIYKIDDGGMGYSKRSVPHIEKRGRNKNRVYL